MRKTFASLGGIAAATLLGLTAAQAQQEPIKIGIISTYSGQFADVATMMDAGIRLYMRKHGDTIGGRKVEIIRKDSGTGGTAPDVARRLAQELIVRDKVDVIAGFSLTPEALAAADVSVQAKKVMVSMNAATAIITARSPYFARTSVALPMIANTAANWAIKNGINKTFTMVSDFGPGIDSEVEYHRAFKEVGGEIVGSVRTPVQNPDFSAFAQRLKDSGAPSVFAFVPGGEQPAAVAKAFADRGINPQNMKVIVTGEIVNDEALKNMGDAALGIISVWHYDYNHKSALNAEFVKGINELLNGRNPDQFAVTAYDGMHLIYEALKKTGGKSDGDTLIGAMKGMAWESPRGRMSIDPETRDVVQSVYIRRVERIGNRLGNVEFAQVDNVKDPVKARMKAEGKLNPDGTAKP